MFKRITGILSVALACALLFGALASCTAGRVPTGTKSGEPTGAQSARPSGGTTNADTPSLLEKLGEADLMKGIVASSAPAGTPDARFISAQYDLSAKLLSAFAAKDRGQNVLLSPLSIEAAFLLIANGAGGETLKEFEEFFGGMPIDDLNSNMRAYLAGLYTGEKANLSVADSIWVKNTPTFTVNRDFLQKNADCYGAEIYKRAFDDETLDLINAWCKKNTDGMIDHILDEFPEEAVMVLINALFFESAWNEEFQTDLTMIAPFTNYDGSKTSAYMMRGNSYSYLSGDGFTGFTKSYYGYYFAALMPDENVDLYDFTASLDGEKLSSVLGAKKEATVLVTMPVFEAAYETDLIGTLSQLGLSSAFNADKADFSGLGVCTDGDLYIGQAKHKTYITVTESGTRAAAVTGILPEAVTADVEEYSVVLDRPFVYMIVDALTDTPIFIGAQATMAP